MLIVVDDLGWADLGCQGSAVYETPHIDALAAGGLRFTQAYAACAVCSPTRAALMTGRMPARTGVTDWIRPQLQRGAAGTPDANPTEYVGGPNDPLLCPPNPFWMEHEEVTVAELLKNAGYRTGHVGKWHLGDEGWFPTSQGYDENFGGCDYGQPPSYFDPYADKRHPEGIPTLPSKQPGQYLTDREADEAVGFIERHADEPFFLSLWHYCVHTPLQAPPEETARWKAKIAGMPDVMQKNAAYAAMVASVDRAAGRVIETLDRLGLRETTLVIFTSDNGGLLSSTNNSPLRSGKGYPYEGGIRVPLIVNWPGVVPANESAIPVISVDLPLTILEACGVAPPEDRPLDGASLLELAKTGGRMQISARPLVWHFPHYRQQDVVPYSILRDGDLKLIKRYEGPTFELYDLSQDPSEKKDLAKNRPEDVDRLDAKLSQILAEAGAKLPRENPAYRPQRAR
ncbi:MAG TPA: sulfatase [Pirellulaceae bacterium]|nr:sulfatase [Pirellulaceae bacterium]